MDGQVTQIGRSFLVQSMSREKVWYLFTPSGIEIEIINKGSYLKFDYQIGYKLVRKLKKIILKVPVEKKTVNKNDRKLTDQDVLVVFYYKQLGLTHKEIANKFNIARGRITEILNGNAYKHIKRPIEHNN